MRILKPVDYKKTQIYTLVNSENATVYVGMTTQKLSRRYSGHVFSSADGQSALYSAMRTIGAAKFRIVLHHTFPCKSQAEAEAEEIRTMQEFISAGIPLYNTRTQENMHVVAIKMTVALTGESNANFSSGFITYRVDSKKDRMEWQFRYRKNNAGVTKGFSVKKFGFWQAKLLAEEERKRIYPLWKTDEEVTCAELLLIEW